MSASAKASYFARSALHGMRRAPFIHFIAILTVAIALFALGLTRGADVWLRSMIAQLGGQVEATIYLANGATQDSADALARRLAAQTHGTAKVVTPDAALERLRHELGSSGTALTALPSNPLPFSIELRLPKPLRTASRLRALSARIRAMPKVSAVDYGQAAVERLSAISKAIRFGAAVAFVVVLGATVVIVSATLQLAIYARRDELEIQKLVGATDRFVKTPFLIEGLLQGLLGAVLAGGALWGFAVWAGPKLAAIFAFAALPRIGADVLSVTLALEMLAAGAGLGLCGSFLAVGRFLRP